MDPFETIAKKLAARPVRLVEPGSRAHAAVAMILTPGAAGPEVLLIERAVNEKDLWSGHAGFPGGRVEGADNNDPRLAAERETFEELGIDLGSARFLGRLGDIVPGGLPVVVSCFVYAVAHPPVPVLDADEVARAFWLPLKESENPDRCTTVRYGAGVRTRTFPALNLLPWTPQPLWGLSFRLLRNFRKIVD